MVILKKFLVNHEEILMQFWRSFKVISKNYEVILKKF